MKNLFVFLCLVPMVCNSQSVKDSILMRERSIDRPITLHKGQLRIEGGYGLSAITKRFDDDGDKINLRDEGLSYVRHTWYVDLRYGIVENLHIQVSTNYRRQAQRIQQLLTVNASEFTELFEIQNRTGLEDLVVTLSGRAPLKTKMVDLVATGGIYLPLGQTQSGKPEHSISVDDSSPGITFRNITYRYYSNWGNGSPMATFGGTVKVRTKDFAFTGSVLYDQSLGEGEETSWQHQLVNNKFEYQRETYTYQSPNRISFTAEIERQLAPWFDLSLIFQSEQSKGGWDEGNGIKYSRPEANLYTFNPGYEILVTPKIWLRQRLGVTLAGKNVEAPFSIYTSLVYNFFPFN